jgi:hypothetical protein
MPPQVQVQIKTNDTQVLIHVSVFGKTFIGWIAIEVIEDLHERFDMSPEQAKAYVVRHQQAFTDIVLAKFVSAPTSFTPLPGTPDTLKAELQLKDWGLLSRPSLMPELGSTNHS